jgi:hypothetical protein
MDRAGDAGGIEHGDDIVLAVASDHRAARSVGPREDGDQLLGLPRDGEVFGGDEVDQVPAAPGPLHRRHVGVPQVVGVVAGPADQRVPGMGCAGPK